MSMDVIDYEIFGDDMQYVEIELDPGEAAIGEAGAMMMMQDGVEMDTVFGDGSQAAATSGLMGKLLGAGKRLITGESLFTTVYHNESQLKRRVAFAAPYPGRIVPINLAEMGGTFICQKDAFLCAARGVSLGIAFQRKLGTALFGGEGFIMQKLDGDGLAFVHAGGTLAERTLGPGEVLRVDTGCVVGFPAQHRFRHPICRQAQVGNLRRRRPVLRHPARTGQGVVAIAADLAPGRPRAGLCAARRWRRSRGRLAARHPRQRAGR